MSEYIISILRRRRGDNTSYRQDFRYESRSVADTVASALRFINSKDDIRDINGENAEPILWESSCIQQKCGACAMVINGRPGLACSARLTEFKKNIIRLEPLHKFPVIADLMTDRTILRENLKTLNIWLNADAKYRDEDADMAFEASECIQCGCCLEICPNFYNGGVFSGMSSVPLMTRLLTEGDRDDYINACREYEKHVFEGCGKSLACRKICPRNINTEKMMVNANAIAVWRRKK